MGASQMNALGGERVRQLMTSLSIVTHFDSTYLSYKYGVQSTASTLELMPYKDLGLSHDGVKIASKFHRASSSR